MLVLVWWRERRGEKKERENRSIKKPTLIRTRALCVLFPPKITPYSSVPPPPKIRGSGEIFGFRRWSALRWLERSWLRDLSKSSGAVASSSSFSFALSLVARSPPHHHQLTLSRPSSTPTTTKCAPLSRSLARSTDLPTVTRRASKLRSDHSSISPLQHHRHHRQIHPPPCRLKEAKEAIAFQRE